MGPALLNVLMIAIYPPHRANQRRANSKAISAGPKKDSSGALSVTARFLLFPESWTLSPERLAPRRCLLRRDCRADHPRLRVVGDDLDRVALQRTHLDHLLQIVLQHGQIDKAHVEAGQEELARAVHMDRARRPRRQRLVPQVPEILAASVARLGRGEDLLRL